MPKGIKAKSKAASFVQPEGESTAYSGERALPLDNSSWIGEKDPRSLIYMSMSAEERRPDGPVKPPYWLLRALAFIGRRLDYTLD